MRAAAISDIPYVCRWDSKPYVEDMGYVTECWRMPTTDPNGYARRGTGQWAEGEKSVHRAAWRYANDALIPKGWEIDHLCFVRNCFRPSHLECITLAENRKRRRAFIGPRKPRPTPLGLCRHGHPWSANAVKNTQGAWICRSCRREAAARRYARVLAMRDPPNVCAA